MTTRIDGCKECGIAYSFVFGMQFHTATCPVAEIGTVGPRLVFHICDENSVPYKSDGALGHGWECGICGKFLQAG